MRAWRTVEASEDGKWRSGIVSVLRLLFFGVGVFLVIILYVPFVHRLEFDGIGGDHLEVRAALRARDDLPFIDFIFLDVEIGLAFRAVQHASLHAEDILYI
jgi:hypothetical protein